MEIPAGARNIRITERAPTSNYLSLASVNGQYFLNGNWKIEFSKSFKFGGAIFSYVRNDNSRSISEWISSPGPINEPLVLFLLYQETNKGISYEYTLDQSVGAMIEPRIYENSERSVLQSPSSASTLLNAVPNSYLTHYSQHYQWWTGSWTRCSRRCGGGQQQRRVICVQIVGTPSNEAPHSENSLPNHLRVASEHLCDAQLKPVAIQQCNTHVCPPTWLVGSWSSCLCDLNIKTRSVSCRKGAVHPDTGRPIQDQWIATDDSECEQVRGSERSPARLAKCEVTETSSCVSSESFIVSMVTTNKSEEARSSEQLDELLDEFIARVPERNCTIKQPYAWKTGNWSQVNINILSFLQN